MARLDLTKLQVIEPVKAKVIARFEGGYITMDELSRAQFYFINNIDEIRLKELQGDAFELEHQYENAKTPEEKDEIKQELLKKESEIRYLSKPYRKDRYHISVENVSSFMDTLQGAYTDGQTIWQVRRALGAPCENPDIQDNRSLIDTWTRELN